MNGAFTPLMERTSSGEPGPVQPGSMKADGMVVFLRIDRVCPFLDTTILR
jgi:hypothetical protein